jgi:hypothetical protein
MQERGRESERHKKMLREEYDNIRVAEEEENLTLKPRINESSRRIAQNIEKRSEGQAQPWKQPEPIKLKSRNSIEYDQQREDCTFKPQLRGSTDYYHRMQQA